MQRDGGPGGPGAGGNPTGGSFTGPAEALEIVGNHAYAYANTTANTTAATLFNFTSGNYYFVGMLEFNPELDFDNASSGIATCRIKMNGAIVGLLITESTDFYRSSLNLIIPAYTEVTVEVKSTSTAADEILTISLTGRIYRG